MTLRGPSEMTAEGRYFASDQYYNNHMIKIYKSHDQVWQTVLHVHVHVISS